MRHNLNGKIRLETLMVQSVSTAFWDETIKSVSASELRLHTVVLLVNCEILLFKACQYRHRLEKTISVHSFANFLFFLRRKHR